MKSYKFKIISHDIYFMLVFWTYLLHDIWNEENHQFVKEIKLNVGRTQKLGKQSILGIILYFFEVIFKYSFSNIETTNFIVKAPTSVM